MVLDDVGHGQLSCFGGLVETPNSDSQDGGLAPGRHLLRDEFEPAGPPDTANGKGVPGRGPLSIDGTLVGATDFPEHNAAVP